MIKLEKAMILWNCNKFENSLDYPNGIIAVVDCASVKKVDTGRYMNSVGACFLSWKHATDSQRMLELLAYMTNIVVNDKIEHSKVHEAFLNIEEYAEFCKDPQVWVENNK